MISIITDIAFVIALACSHQRGSRFERCSSWINSFSLLTWAAIGFNSLHRLGAASAGGDADKATTASSATWIREKQAFVFRARMVVVTTSAPPASAMWQPAFHRHTRQQLRGQTLYFPASRSANSATVLA
jgi:hypothetical protein